MSELDTGRRADAQPVATPALGKLRSLNANARLGQQTGEGLEDLFAQVFAHIAQSRPLETADDAPSLDDSSPLVSSESSENDEIQRGPERDQPTTEREEATETLVSEPRTEFETESDYRAIKDEAIEPVDEEATDDVKVQAKTIESHSNDTEVVDNLDANPVLQTSTQEESSGRRRRRKEDATSVDDASLPSETKVQRTESDPKDIQQTKTSLNQDDRLGEVQPLGEGGESTDRPRRLRDRRNGDRAQHFSEPSNPEPSGDDALMRALAAQKSSGGDQANGLATAQANLGGASKSNVASSNPAAAVTQTVTQTAQNATNGSQASAGGGSAKSIQAIDGASALQEPRNQTDAKAQAAKKNGASTAETVSRVKLIQRVSKAFQHLGPDGGTVRLRLAPAELGSVRVEMRIQQRSVQARVVAETEAASNALREHLPELRQRLESQGLQIERLEVETDSGDRETSDFQHRGDEQHADRHWQRGRRPSSSWQSQEPAAASTSRNVEPLTSPVSRWDVATNLADGVDLTL